MGTAAGVALEIKIAPLVAELGGGRWQVDMAAVSRHWPEELGGGRVQGGEWGRVCGRLGVSEEGQKPGEWRGRRERSRRY